MFVCTECMVDAMEGVLYWGWKCLVKRCNLLMENASHAPLGNMVL